VKESDLFRDREKNKMFLLGTNYWPSSSAINMWTEWNPDELTDDIIRMKGLGMNCCRPFLFMPDFLNTDGSVQTIALERFQYFLKICEENKLGTFPTFIVGHMSGEDWGMPWLRGSELIKDRSIIELTKSYIATVVQTGKGFKYVLGWLLSNELPNFIGRQDPAIVAEWVAEIIQTVRAIDPERPVSVGDGAWAPEIIGEQTGFHLRKLNPIQDFVGLHFYPRGMSPWHHTFTAAYRLQMAKVWNKPVIVEEFGTSTTLCSEENQANYYRTVFFSALINGARGMINWCLNDFDFKDKRPYSHHLFEERFGIIRTDKSLKPAAYEFERFHKIYTDLNIGGFKQIESNIGLFIPSNYYYDYPYQFKPEVESVYDFYLECFSLLKRANLDISMIVEPAQELENAGSLTHELSLQSVPVLFLPRLKFMTKFTRTALEEYIRGGGVVYCSFANDSWVTDWDRLCGVQTDCKFGVPDFRETDNLEITVSYDWGDFRQGERFTLPLFNDQPAYGYCPIISTTAKILMTDQFGMPFLLENRIDKGKVYFTPYPLEVISLKINDETIKRNIGRIFRMIAHLNRPQPEILIESDGLESGVWKNGNELRVIILNHSWSEQTGLISLRESAASVKSSIPIIKKSESVFQLTLPRKEVAYLSIK